MFGGLQYESRLLRSGCSSHKMLFMVTHIEILDKLQIFKREPNAIEQPCRGTEISISEGRWQHYRDKEKFPRVGVWVMVED